MVTFIAQKNIVAEQPFVTFLRLNRLSEPIDIALQFRGKNIFSSVPAGKGIMKRFEFTEGGKKFGSSASFDFNMTIFRNGKCSRRHLPIPRFIKKTYVFIQTDKAIYKPGDKVQYRVVVLDHQLRAKFFNKLKIKFVMPGNRDLDVFTNMTKRSNGLYEDEFSLNPEISLGEWQLKVTVENKVSASKSFKVEKYKLPLYKLYVHVPLKVSLRDKKFHVMIEAKYSFGGYVSGMAEVSLQQNGTIEGRTLTNKISTQWNFEVDLEEDFGIRRLRKNPTIFDLVVKFKEDPKIYEDSERTPEVVKIAFYYDRYCDIKIKHLPKAQGSLTYSFDVIIEDFDGNLLINDLNPVTAKLNQGRGKSEITKTAKIQNRITSFVFENVTHDVRKKINIKFRNCELNVDVDDEKLNDTLHIKHSPRM